jgi:hypothetical protein
MHEIATMRGSVAKMENPMRMCKGQSVFEQWRVLHLEGSDVEVVP